jgi:hypothetical protein
MFRTRIVVDNDGVGTTRRESRIAQRTSYTRRAASFALCVRRVIALNVQTSNAQRHTAYVRNAQCDVNVNHTRACDRINVKTESFVRDADLRPRVCRVTTCMYVHHVETLPVCVHVWVMPNMHNRGNACVSRHVTVCPV